MRNRSASAADSTSADFWAAFRAARILASRVSNRSCAVAGRGQLVAEQCHLGPQSEQLAVVAGHARDLIAGLRRVAALKGWIAGQLA